MVWRYFGIGLWMIATAATARAQDAARVPYPIPEVPGQPLPGSPSDSTVIRTHPGGEIAPSRRVESRTRASGVETATSIIERPDGQGRLRPSVETTTETVRRPNGERTRIAVFAFDQSGRRMLVESIESEQEVRADGSIDTVRNTSSLDPTGRATLTSREIERTRSVSPGVKETETSILRPGPNQALVEAERVSETEREVAPGLVRREMTRSVRDGNGRFQAAEARSEDIRTTGSTESREAIVQRLDATGKMSVDERTVSQRSTVNGREQTTEETFSRQGAAREGTLQLNRRVTRTTTSAADGSSRTDEDVEARTSFAPGEPLRPVQRSVRTIRNVDGRSETQQQVLEPDVNRQMKPRVEETGTATAPSSNARFRPQ